MHILTLIRIQVISELFHCTSQFNQTLYQPAPEGFPEAPERLQKLFPAQADSTSVLVITYRMFWTGRILAIRVMSTRSPGCTLVRPVGQIPHSLQESGAGWYNVWLNWLVQWNNSEITWIRINVRICIISGPPIGPWWASEANFDKNFGHHKAEFYYVTLPGVILGWISRFVRLNWI